MLLIAFKNTFCKKLTSEKILNVLVRLLSKFLGIRHFSCFRQEHEEDEDFCSCVSTYLDFNAKKKKHQTTMSLIVKRLGKKCRKEKTFYDFNTNEIVLNPPKQKSGGIVYKYVDEDQNPYFLILYFEPKPSQVFYKLAKYILKMVP